MENSWRTEYEIGHSEIDREHRVLIEVLRVLSTGYCDRDLVDTQIKMLERYVFDHFEHEERLLRQGDYPRLSQHQGLHQQFRAKVARMRAAWADSDHPDLQAEIAADLFRWLIEHIQGADRAYVPWLPKP